jgi:urease accessory protein
VRLGFERRGERTVAREQYCHGALKVMRGLRHPGSRAPHWTLMNPGGGYVDGDRYSIALRLGAGCDAVVDSQCATKVYRCEGDDARQTMRVSLGEDAVLGLRPHPLIAYRDARYVQDTVVEMDPSAVFSCREIVTSGWSADGREFAFDSVRMRLRVDFVGGLTGQTGTTALTGRTALVDNLVLEPGAVDPRSPVALGGFSHVGTVAVVAEGLPSGEEVRDVCRAAGGVAAGVGGGRCRIGVGGVPGVSMVVRCLGGETEEVERVLAAAEKICGVA